MNDWDRAYIEHLIQRDEADTRDRAQYLSYLSWREETMSSRVFGNDRDPEQIQYLFMGGDRYYWDIHNWVVALSGLRSHHEYLVMPCPTCRARLHLSLYPSWYPAEPDSSSHIVPDDHSRPSPHASGCEFFKAEQTQWVDDYADLRRGETVTRRPSASEQILFRMLGVDNTHVSVSVTEVDGQLVRHIR